MDLLDGFTWLQKILIGGTISLAALMIFGLFITLMIIGRRRQIAQNMPPAHAPAVVPPAVVVAQAPAPAVTPVVVAPAPGAAAPRVVVVSTSSLWRNLWWMAKWLLAAALLVAAVTAVWFYWAELVLWVKNHLPSGDSATPGNPLGDGAGLPDLKLDAPAPTTPWQDLTQLDFSSYWASWGTHALLAALAALIIVLMLVAAFKSLRTAFSGWGLVWALTLFALLAAMFFFASPYLAAFAGWVTKRIDETTREEVLGLVIFSLAMFVLIVKLLLGTSTRWTTTATVAAVVLISILIGPSVIDWTNKNTPICFGEAACYKMEVRKSETEAQIAYSKQAAIEKARRDAVRLVSPVCTGGRKHLDLLPGESREINPNRCAIYSVTTRGAIIYVSLWGKRSNPIGPEGGRVDYMSTSVEAPSSTHASLDYVLCTGDGSIPVDDTCLPLHRTAALP